MFDTVQITTPKNVIDDVLRINNTSGETKVYNFDSILEYSDTYTFSCWMKSETNTTIDVYLGDNVKSFDLTNEWTRIVYSAYCNTDINRVVKFTIPNNILMYAYEGQLEHGNKATDFSLNDEDILEKVIKVEETVTVLQTDFVVEQGKIEALIKETTIVEEDGTTVSLKEAFSQVVQTVDGFESIVSNKVGIDEVISRINQSAEQISIQASKISLEGIVTANQNFKILQDGSIEAKNGKFGGDINATSGYIGGIQIQDGDLVCHIDCDEPEGYWTDGSIAKGFNISDDGTIVLYRDFGENTYMQTGIDDSAIYISYSSGRDGFESSIHMSNYGLILTSEDGDNYYYSHIYTDNYHPGLLRIESTNGILLNSHRFQDDSLCFYKDEYDALDNVNRKGWIGHGGTTEMRMQNEAGNILCLTANGVSIVAELLGTGSTSNGLRMTAAATDKVNLGFSTARWLQVYAKNTGISTSDRNKKKNFKELNDLYYELAKKIEIISYQFKDTEQPDNVGRTHIGSIAQQVEEAMEELGMTSKDFAGFCKDLKQKVEVDDNGKEIFTPIEGEYDYSLRYDEIEMLKLWYLEETSKRQQQEIDLLKQEIIELKGV